MNNITLSVKISAPTLSSLLHENINSLYDQEGFLLGNINTTIVKSVTDNSAEDVNIKEVISITGVLPCDLPNMYYQADGELIKDKLNELLGKEKNNVVAWFKYKKNRKYGLRFSIREKILHDELSKFLNISSNLFTCCLLSTYQSDNKSTQIFSHAFVTMQSYNIKMVPMHIENLGDSCHTYQPNIKPSDAFMKLYKKINKDQSDLYLSKNIHEKLKSELAKSIGGLESTELKLWKLRKEVDELSQKLKKSVLSSNPWSSVGTNEINGEVGEFEISTPLSPEICSTLLPESEADEKHSSSNLVVDLTMSDEDEDSSGKSKLRDKRK